MSDAREGYAPGWAPDAVAMMASRTSDRRAGFLMPFLRSGMRVLDVGCGPGTITLGLARAVGPGGTVVGVDIATSQVELARRTARSARVENVGFRVGSAYALPFADGSFDAAFAHGLVEHLARPRAALGELRRVLAPGGVVGVCSSDWSGAVIEPRTGDVDAALACHFALRRRAGGDPFAGGRLRALVLAAGFVDVSTTVMDEADLSYHGLASYVGDRIEAAMTGASATERIDLVRGAAAARRWERDGGRFTQRWVAVTAQKWSGARDDAAP
jgi:SAM-dependent methyltransferase